jgi:hypothetical protein
MIQEKPPGKTAKTIRQDLSFIVGALLLLSVALAALTGLSSDEAEFFGLGDDLHALAGWSVVVLTALHTILLGGQMIRYAKRRLRRRFGVGAVIGTSPASAQEQELRDRRRSLDETEVG